MTTAVTVDVAGGPAGGAARFRTEVCGYVERRPRADVKIIGMKRRLDPAWLALREAAAARRSRRVALNNVGFLTPGGERWTLLANALHFLTGPETEALEPALRAMMARQISVVHRAARRSDVLIAPCTAMAERIAGTLPEVADRVTVRMHPVSASRTADRPAGTGDGGETLILCPIVFESYKQMPDRLAEWLTAVGLTRRGVALDDSVRMVVTATPAEVPPALAASPRLEFTGRLSHAELIRLWNRSRAVYFPPGLEAFGFPLAEARVNGQPVIARDTPQNREIAGLALCGYTIGDPDSLRAATETALAGSFAPDPAPFDPDAYFDWLLDGTR
ncbi:MAG TPA: glycosyltransferase [Streptosporangiaceae bacterium]